MSEEPDDTSRVTRLVARVARLAAKPDDSSGTDARFAFAVQVGDGGHQTINVGIGPLVPPPGSAAAAVVDSVTLGLRPPPVLEGLVIRARKSRWVVVTGSAGAGKSAVVCALARPDLCDGLVPQGGDHFVHAVVPLDATSTAWWLAEELAEQFRISIPRYSAAVAACRNADPQEWEQLSLWDQRVRAPLALLHQVDTAHTTNAQKAGVPGTPAVRVVFDGWEQANEKYAPDVHQVIHDLAHDESVPVHVIVAARADSAAEYALLRDATPLILPPPIQDDVADYLRARQLRDDDADEIADLCTQGHCGWLLARLIGDGYTSLDPHERVSLVDRLSLDPDRPALVNWLYEKLLNDAISDLDEQATSGDRRGFEWLRPVLAALAVAGPGATMPRKMVEATAARDASITRDDVEKVLKALDRMVIRAHRNTERELLGLFHSSLVTYLDPPQEDPLGTEEAHKPQRQRNRAHWVDVVNTRRIMLDEIEHLAPVDGLFHDNPLARWAENAEVDYLWEAGMPRAAIRAMIRRPLPTPRENLDRFDSALPRLLKELGPDDRHVLVCRAEIAYWTGQTGDWVRALNLLRRLLPDRETTLGRRHPDTLKTRSNIAHFTGKIGDHAGALYLYKELLLDREAVLGPNHADTLNTRSGIAFYTGECGDAIRALDLFRKLLPDQAAALGTLDPGTLNTRSNIASWTGECGDTARALKLFGELLPDQVTVFGPRHPLTLITRSNIAYYTRACGDAAGALAIYRELLRDREAMLGPRHPDTLKTVREIDSLMT